MGRQAAKKLAESETLSIGDLKLMVTKSRGSSASSRVNPQFTLDQTCDIYEAALQGRDDAEIPKAWRLDPYSATGALKPTRDVLIMTNICRDCG